MTTPSTPPVPDLAPRKRGPKRRNIIEALDIASRAYAAISTPERPVTPLLVKLEPWITVQLDAFSNVLGNEMTVLREVYNEKGKLERIDRVPILPNHIATDLKKSWAALLKLSDMPDAQRLANLHDSLDPPMARALPIEAFCYALAISPLRVLEILTGILVRQGATASTLLTAVWHPKMVEKSIERGLQDDGIADRVIVHKAAGYLPMPKTSQTIVNVNQPATTQSVVFVPAPPPEATIRTLADTFNEARGLPPPVSHPPAYDIDVAPDDEGDEEE